MRKAYAVKNLLLGNGSNSCSCKEGGYYAIGYHCLEKKGSDDGSPLPNTVPRFEEQTYFLAMHRK
jgi:hypothetical protein